MHVVWPYNSTLQPIGQKIYFGGKKSKLSQGNNLLVVPNSLRLLIRIDFGTHNSAGGLKTARILPRGNN